MDDMDREEILVNALKYIKEPAYFEMGDGEEALLLPYPENSQETGLRVILEPGAPDGFRLPEHDNRPTAINTSRRLRGYVRQVLSNAHLSSWLE